MKQIAAEKMCDESTPEVFRFTLRCTECGQLWSGRDVPFSKAGAQPETEGKRIIYRTLYERERERSFQQAARQAEETFSLCPICGRLVCDRCFLVCEDLDICRACAEKLKERGEPVAGNDAPPKVSGERSGSFIKRRENETDLETNRKGAAKWD